MTSVLVDTGPLYALAVPSDEHHTQAQQETERMRQQGLEAIVVYPVLIEAYTLLLRRVALVTAHGWLGEMLTTASFLNPLEEDYLQAAHRVRTYHDQPLTLVDAVLTVLSERLGLPVWSYDYHFDLLRVPRWL